MPPKKQALCEIVFGQMRIPVSDKERGKRAIEGIFMIGEPGKAAAEPRVGKRGRRKAKRVKVVVRRRKIRAASEGKTAAVFLMVFTVARRLERMAWDRCQSSSLIIGSC